jgi:hypothetical protein
MNGAFKRTSVLSEESPLAINKKRKCADRVQHQNEGQHKRVAIKAQLTSIATEPNAYNNRRKPDPVTVNCFLPRNAPVANCNPTCTVASTNFIHTNGKARLTNTNSFSNSDKECHTKVISGNGNDDNSLSLDDPSIVSEITCTGCGHTSGEVRWTDQLCKPCARVENIQWFRQVCRSPGGALLTAAMLDGTNDPDHYYSTNKYLY